MTPTFTVLIGSANRPSLTHTLDSVARQVRVPGDQVIVAFDAFEKTERELWDAVDRVESYGDGFLACTHDAGHHHFGVAQINHALATIPITGSHLFTMGDDDVWVDGAYDVLRPFCAADPLRPILYRFVAPWRELLWDVPRMQMSKISGCCIAAPKAFVGPMPAQTHWPDGRVFAEHDFFWMQEILQKAGREPLWLDRTLVIARPEARGADVTHKGILQCWACQRWWYLEDVNPVSHPYCPNCHAVTDWPGRTITTTAWGQAVAS
jgi:hypothetical protein